MRMLKTWLARGFQRKAGLLLPSKEDRPDSEEVSAIKAKLTQLEHDLKMPKYLFHAPVDYFTESHPPVFAEPISVEGEPLPVPRRSAGPAIRQKTTSTISNGGKAITT